MIASRYTQYIEKFLPPLLGKLQEKYNDKEAEQPLKDDQHKYYEELRPHVRVDLSPPQWEALVDMAFNVGVAAVTKSTLLRLINARARTIVKETRRDSIFQRDSVYLVERWMGDTLIREKTRQIVRYHDRLKTDTIVQIIEREATARQVVEKKKGWWEGLKANLSEVVLLLLLCFIGLFAISRKF